MLLQRYIKCDKKSFICILKEHVEAQNQGLLISHLKQMYPPSLEQSKHKIYLLRQEHPTAAACFALRYIASYGIQSNLKVVQWSGHIIQFCPSFSINFLLKQEVDENLQNNEEENNTIVPLLQEVAVCRCCTDDHPIAESYDVSVNFFLRFFDWVDWAL